MYIRRTVLFAFFVLFMAIDTSAQVAIQSGESPSQISAAPTIETTAQVLFIASDDAGNPAPLPARDSVRLSIDKRLVEIEEIRSLKDSRLFFSVLLDVSGSTRPFADQQIAAATRLFRLLSTGDNRGYLILFKSEVVAIEHFIDTPSVEEILRRFPQQSRFGPTALYDAIIQAAEQLSSARIPRNSRRAIFVLSDGGDNTSHKSLEQTLKLVQNEGIPILSIGFSRDNGSDSSRGELKRDLKTLKTLSDGTGGVVTFLDQPGDPVRRAAYLTDGQCLIMFKTPALKPKKFYSLRIESSVKEIHVMSPTEYFIP